MAEDGIKKRASDDRSDSGDGSSKRACGPRENVAQTPVTNVSCPICLVPLSGEVATPDTCQGHAFCPPCLRSWTGQSRLCPCDRRPFGAILIRPGVGSDTVLSRESLPPPPPPPPPPSAAQQMLEEQLTQQIQQAKETVQLTMQMKQLTEQMRQLTEQMMQQISAAMAALDGAQEVDGVADVGSADEALLQALVHQVVTKANALLAAFQPPNSNTAEESDSQPTA